MKFPSTRRSAVVAAASGDAAERRRGLEAVVAAYWKPVYKLIRIRWSVSPDDAADLTQAFFARAIEKDFFRTYDASKGTFRTFLRTCLDAYIANERRSADRLKRGGASKVLSLDFADAEGELMHHPPAPGADLEQWFHREWVRSVFALAVDDLRKACEPGGRETSFRMFERYHLEHESSYEDLAREFGVPLTTVTNRLAAMRREFRNLLLARLRETSSGEDEYRADAKLLLG